MILNADQDGDGLICYTEFLILILILILILQVTVSYATLNLLLS